MSEEMVPDYLAFFIAADSGWLTLTKPVVCIRMDISDNEDPDLHELLLQYFGEAAVSSGSQHFILSADPGINISFFPAIAIFPGRIGPVALS